MPIVVNLDVMMAKRKMSLNELSAKVGVTLANLSILKNNHAKAVRFTTLEAICRAQGSRPVSPMLQHKSPASQKPMRAGETLCVKHPEGQAPPAGQGPGAGAPPSCPLSGTGR